MHDLFFLMSQPPTLPRLFSNDPKHVYVSGAVPGVNDAVRIHLFMFELNIGETNRYVCKLLVFIDKIGIPRLQAIDIVQVCT